MKQWQYEGRDGTRQSWPEAEFDVAGTECLRTPGAAGNGAGLQGGGEHYDVKANGVIIGTLRLVDVQPAPETMQSNYPLDEQFVASAQSAQEALTPALQAAAEHDEPSAGYAPEPGSAEWRKLYQGEFPPSDGLTPAPERARPSGVPQAAAHVVQMAAQAGQPASIKYTQVRRDDDGQGYSDLDILVEPEVAAAMQREVDAANAELPQHFSGSGGLTEASSSFSVGSDEDWFRRIAAGALAPAEPLSDDADARHQAHEDAARWEDGDDAPAA